MQLIATINPEQTTEQESKTYQIREAVRAIVIDEQNNLAILHVTNYQYYKLPGGGINPGENKLTALKRECLEEIGCEIEITAELGKIIEYRKMW
ncbi:MAG: NUDIX domain-containing protein, partial [Candidatus Pacebacteria bacterium]|nr:NUDIX domain-containing protein [Candidatus Paceibacterota bacterium]